MLYGKPDYDYKEKQNGHCSSISHPERPMSSESQDKKSSQRSLSSMDRRALLKGAFAGSLALSSIEASGAPKKKGLIAEENQRPGTRDWLLTKTRIDPETVHRSPGVEGYCSHTSIRAGETSPRAFVGNRQSACRSARTTVTCQPAFCTRTICR